MAKRKKPKIAKEPSPDKIPVVSSDPNSFNQMNPSWRLSSIQLVDPFGWHSLDLEKISEIKIKLGSFEAMTWNQIFVEAKKQNHSVNIDLLSKKAQKRLKEINLIDIDQLWSLRLSGKERVWGILDRGVFNL